MRTVTCRRRPIALSVVLLSAVPAVTVAPAAGNAPRPPEHLLAREQADPLLGGPLVVDGEPIPEVELRRHLIHAVGGRVLERARLRWMVEAELTERAHRHAVHAGKPQDETFARTYGELQRALAPGDKELADELRYQRSLLDWRRDGLDADAAIRRDYGTLDEYREHVRTTLLFDRVFLPEDPDEWPRITLEAFLADPGGGQVLVDDARESYRTRLRLGEEYGDDPPRDDESLRRIYRDIVRRSLTSWLDIRTVIDGLPAPLVATVDFDADGVPEERLEVDDLWPEVRPLVDAEDVRLARHWLATVAATRSRLLASGHGPEAELRELARRALSPRDDGRYSTAWIGEFPSVEVYFEYLWLREGVRRRFGRELAAVSTPPQPSSSLGAQVPASLTEPVRRVRAIAGHAQVTAEFLLLAAWDEETATWNEDGWACARERADELAELLQRRERIYYLQVRRFRPVTVPAPRVLWRKALDEHSEFWEPEPLRTAPPAEPLHKGHFGPRGFDELCAMLRVTEYRRFALGGSLADAALFDLPERTIVGPRRGPLGYYLVWVDERGTPTHEVAPAEWLDAVLDEATLDYARNALADAAVSGLD